MKIKAVFSDLDDTLLDEKGQLSPETLRVVHQCIRQGVAFIPVSGRNYASMRPYAVQLNTGLPYIGCNGAQQVSADHQLLEEAVIPAELAREICAFLQAQGFYVQAYHDEFFYYAEECENALQYKNSSGMQGVAVGDLLAYLTFPVPKLLSIAHPDEVKRVLPLVTERFEGKAAFTLSKPYFIEAIPYGVSKGSAIKALLDKLGISPEEAMAFGDSLNDIPMLQAVGCGVAMGNAREETKKAVDFVCLPNTHDGVARFLEKYVLNKQEGL
ncbi:MAG: Cof-type HAD-IIB family hydrolase [Eubacteriales bacterium]|nr:Cof-type HAD-IIB family hydrolase [Eubacteriales bacterium]